MGKEERIKMKAAKAEARSEAVDALLDILGVDSVEEAKALLVARKAPVAASVTDAGKPPAKTYSQEDIDRVLDQERTRRRIERDLLAAGVKPEDLDYAMHRYAQKTAGLDAAAAAKLDAKEFAKELPAHLFVSAGGGTATTAEADAAKKVKDEADAKAAADKLVADKAAADKKAEEDAAAAVAAKATTGSPGGATTRKPGEGPAPKDWSKVPRQERDQRVQEILASA